MATNADRLMDLVILAAKRLDECRMCRFDERSGNLAATDLGRVASHFYLKHETVETFNRLMKPYMPDGDIINLICHAEEFNAMKVRDEEINELDRLAASPSVLRLPLRTTLAEGGKHVSVKRDDVRPSPFPAYFGDTRAPIALLASSPFRPFFSYFARTPSGRKKNMRNSGK